MDKILLEEVLKTIKKQIDKHLVDYQSEIGKAYETMGKLLISLFCELTPEGDDVRVQTNISFNERKIKK